MDIKKFYDSGTTERMYYLQAADRVAKLTLPYLCASVNENYGTYKGSGAYTVDTGAKAIAQAPPNSYSGGAGSDSSQPYSSSGTIAVTSLASSILRLLFPINVPWFQLQAPRLPPELSALNGPLDDSLAQLEQSIISDLMAHQYHAILLPAIQELIVIGHVLVHKLPQQTGLRYLSLKSFIVHRENGQVRKLAIREQYDGNMVWTYVDYETGEVYQQDDKQDNGVLVENAKASDYIVVSTTVPVDANYSYGYAHRFYGLMNTINRLTRDMLRATAIASKAVIIYDPGSWDPNDLARAESAEALAGDANSLHWFTAEQKLNEWTWVWSAIQALKQELAQSFALGLSQQPALNTDRQTAESVRRLSEELDSQAGSLSQVMQSTLQKPLAEAYLDDAIQAFKKIRAGAIADPKVKAIVEALQKVRPVVTSGSSALSRLSELQRLFELLGIFQADPNFQAQIDTIMIFRHAAKIIGLEVDQFIRQAPQISGQATPGMVPPQTPPGQPPQAAY